MSTVKLEVGAWYKHEYVDGNFFLQLVDPLTGRDGRTIGMWNPEKPSDDWRSDPAYLTGPYHIEPGDKVRKKNKDDKCWEEADKLDGVCWMNCTTPYKKDQIIQEVGVSRGLKSNQAIVEDGTAIPLSCLILLEKGAKAEAQDFQVGDEVEFLGFKCNRHGEINWQNLTVGKTYRLKHKSCFDKDDEVAIERDDKDRCLNPRVLPSVSGSELLWPDVKTGIELDTLPSQTSYASDADERIAMANENLVTMFRNIRNAIQTTDCQYMSNSDRERIRKIIPEIERKLTQLKGRL